MKYRADIDGLRALAVLPVILFHAGLDGFKGGYVGVDIFFVISGYLITTILIDELSAQKFNLVTFYERRARRILPALFCVMFACIGPAWLLMPSVQFLEFGKSLVGVTFFASNILFWRESGYFDLAAEQKPLLHTWSLAVEEQFYLLFPLLLIFIWRWDKGRVWIVILMFALVSLLLSEIGGRYSPTANFYLAPFRAWELFVGAMASLTLKKYGLRNNNLVSWLGLLLMCVAIFTFDKQTPVPGLWGLLPVGGAYLVIVFSGPSTKVSWLLSRSALVKIGLLSYSAYLWHQPLFAFARLSTPAEPTEMVMLILSGAALFIGYGSWKYIEQPFRSVGRFSGARIFKMSLTGMILFSTIGLTIVINNGFSVASDLEKKVSVGNDTVSPGFNPVYVIGDSHASHLLDGLQALVGDGVVDLGENGCIPFRGVDRFDNRTVRGACVKAIGNHLDTLAALSSPTIVVVTSMGPVYLDGTTFKGKDVARVTGLGVQWIADLSVRDHYKVFALGMRSTLEELSRNPNLHIIYALDVPELGIDFGCRSNSKRIELGVLSFSDLVAPLEASECAVSRKEYDERSARYKALVREVLEDFPQVKLFDPTPVFCNDSLCRGYLEGYGFLYSDVDHLSSEGSLLYAENLIRSLATLEE